MTARRGSEWKTSWRRQKPALGAGTQLMWFFSSSSGDFYLQPDPSPSTGGTAPPFWFGSVQATSAPALPLISDVERASAWRSRLRWDGLVVQSSAEVEPTLDALSVVVPTYNAPLSDFQVRVVVQLVTVEPVNAGFRYVLWVDGSRVAEQVETLAYVPGTTSLQISPQDGFVNSMAGGNALPTDAEVRAWFTATRQALAAQPIAGKTQDRFDAGSVPGLTPATLTNLAGGQDADLIVADADMVNVELRAVFGY